MEQMFSTAYKRYALAALTTLYTVNHFDRGLMGLLLQPIKEDLQLSDTELGFLTGIAFALFYATLGVPIGRWADRGNRVTITCLTMALWSLTNMTLIFVTSFAQLLFVRIFAAIGDAGCKPLTYSLLGDYFPGAAERTRAMYIWWLSGPVAALIVWTAAGWLNERYGWRNAFFIAGLLGLPLAALVKWSLIEPRTRIPAVEAHTAPAVPLQAVFALLWRQPSCRHLILALILMFTIGVGAGTWQAAFMIRRHGMGTAELGTWMGLIAGLGGIVSTLLGRYVVGRWFATNDRGQMLLSAAALALGAPIFIGFLMAQSKQQALLALLLQTLVFGAFLISPYVMMQRLVPDGMRATVLMIVMFLANLIGMGAGPLLVGSMSDLLTPTLGVDGLRYAMMIMSVGWLWASYHFTRVARTIDEDLRNAARYKAAELAAVQYASEQYKAEQCKTR
jgi:MFS family permease